MALETVPIDSNNLEDAVGLLDKGFPSHGRSFWRSMIIRAKQMHKRQAMRDVGYLLLKAGKPVGILLKIKHLCPITQRLVVNLSSWYIEPEHRWYAPLMLLKATSDKNAVYTDFTPTSDVIAINNRLGFKTGYERKLIFPLPLTAIGMGNKNARILSIDEIDQSRIDPKLAQFMLDHSEEMISFYLDDGEILHPMIFQRRTWKNLPLAKLVFCCDMTVLTKYANIVARRLLRERTLFMSAPACENKPVRGAFLTRKSRPVQFKGQWPNHLVNQCYSEAILLPYNV